LKAIHNEEIRKLSADVRMDAAQDFALSNKLKGEQLRTVVEYIDTLNQSDGYWLGLKQSLGIPILLKTRRERVPKMIGGGEAEEVSQFEYLLGLRDEQVRKQVEGRANEEMGGDTDGEAAGCRHARDRQGRAHCAGWKWKDRL
jgi:hypothetical protein